MRTPAEAIAEILERVEPLGDVEEVPLARALGRVLAREVASDLDLPPFEKSAMDGFAVRAADLGGEPRPLRCVGEARAGAPFGGAVPAGACVEIFTGAQVPADCDAVVMVEKSRREGDDVHLDDRPAPGQNVCHRAEDLAVGRPVLPAGRRLRAPDLSVLAAVGCQPVPVFRRPRVVLLTTGDELVPPDRRPGPGQIREGNTLQLAARAAEAGADVENLGIVRDDVEELERTFRRAFESADVVMTTGGVSMGKYDLVGEVFERCGVEPVLHRIAIKPGKPVWFGLRGRVPVFGLPGNPVSCLVGAEVFVRPALARLGGADAEEQAERLRLGRWSGAPAAPNARQQNLPVRVRQAADGVDELEPVPWKSSGDVVGITRAQGLAVLPPDEGAEAGRLLSYRPL